MDAKDHDRSRDRKGPSPLAKELLLDMPCKDADGNIAYPGCESWTSDTSYQKARLPMRKRAGQVLKKLATKCQRARGFLKSNTRSTVSHAIQLATPRDMYDTPDCPSSGINFCAACRKARRDGDAFDARLQSLTRAMWCSRCRRSHWRLDFSPAQRVADEHERVCNGILGYRTLCPHVKLTFDALREGARECDDPKVFISTILSDSRLGRRAHHAGQQCSFCVDSSIQKDTLKRDYYVRLSWTDALSRTANVPPPPPMDLVRRLYGECPAAFGPSWAVQPRRALDCAHHYGDPSSGTASVGTFEDGFLVYNMSPSPELVGYCCSFQLDAGDACSPEWMAQMDADSYGLFEDMEAKNVTWCDDVECATTYELAHSVAIRHVAALPAGDAAYMRIEFEKKARERRRKCLRP